MSIKYTANYYLKRSNKLKKYRKEIIDKVTKDFPRGASVVDMGCGIGDDYRIFTDKGFNSLGVDYDDEMTKHARRRNPDGLFQKKDIKNVKFESSSQYDLVYANGFINMFSKKDMPEILQKLLHISKYVACISSRVYKISSEVSFPKKNSGSNGLGYIASEQLGLPDIPQQLYLSKYTCNELDTLMEDARNHMEDSFKDWRWVLERFERTDPYDKPWVFYVFTRMTLIEMYTKQGYIVMDNFFSLLDVETYSNELESLAFKTPPDHTYLKINDFYPKSKEIIRLENVVCHSEVLSPLFSDSMHTLASWFLGGIPVLFAKDCTTFLYPCQEETVPRQTAKGLNIISPKQITIAISLDYFDKVNGIEKGCLKVAPPEKRIINCALIPPETWQTLATKKGDLIVINGYTPHKFSQNDNHPKKMVFLTFIEMTQRLRDYSPIGLSQELFRNKYPPKK